MTGDRALFLERQRTDKLVRDFERLVEAAKQVAEQFDTPTFVSDRFEQAMKALKAELSK